MDVRIVPDAISNVQLEEFQPSQNEILFHYASRSGNDASELLSLTGPSSLRAQRKREVSSQSARLQPSLSDGNTSMEQLSKGLSGRTQVRGEVGFSFTVQDKQPVFTLSGGETTGPMLAGMRTILAAE